jgi:hypothetical protein
MPLLGLWLLDALFPCSTMWFVPWEFDNHTHKQNYYLPPFQNKRRNFVWILMYLDAF